MADYAPNFTARYVLRYSTLGHEHTMMFRIARGTGVAGLNATILKVAAFLNALAPARYADWTPISATYTPEDSDVSVPTAVPTLTAGAVAVPTNPTSDSIMSLGFVGRSNAGQKARLFVYGTAFAPEVSGNAAIADNFRITAAENGTVDAAVTVLNNGSPNIPASDNQTVGWYSYANLKYNDYWLRQIR